MNGALGGVVVKTLRY